MDVCTWRGTEGGKKGEKRSDASRGHEGGKKDDVFLAAEAKVEVSSSLFSVYEKKGVKIAGIRLPQTPAVWEYNFCETFQICFFLGYAAEKLKC